MTQLIVQGIKELDTALKTLPKGMRKNYLRKALRRGGAIVRDKVKSKAPVGQGPTAKGLKHGRLKRLVRTKARRGGRTYVKVSVFYPKTDARQTGIAGRKNPRDAFYWKFVEFGTRFFPAQPYIRPVVDSSRAQVLRVSIQAVNEGVQKEFAKAKVKRGRA